MEAFLFGGILLGIMGLFEISDDSGAASDTEDDTEEEPDRDLPPAIAIPADPAPPAPEVTRGPAAPVTGSGPALPELPSKPHEAHGPVPVATDETDEAADESRPIEVDGKRMRLVPAVDAPGAEPEGGYVLRVVTAPAPGYARTVIEDFVPGRDVIEIDDVVAGGLSLAPEDYADEQILTEAGVVIPLLDGSEVLLGGLTQPVSAGDIRTMARLT